MPLDRQLTQSELDRVWRRRKLGVSLQRCADDLDVSLSRLDQAIWKWMGSGPKKERLAPVAHNPYTSPSEKYRHATTS